MIIRINNPIIEQNEQTFLDSDVVVDATSHGVQNSGGFNANDYAVMGEYGLEQAELKQIASITDNTNLVTDALKFPHSIDTPLTYIKYNKIYVYSATSKTGTYSAVGNYDIEVDQKFTEVEDTSGDTDTWYKIRFHNSTSNEFSDYADPVKGSGYDDDSVRSVMDRIYINGNDPDRKVLTEEEMMVILNDGYRQAINKVIAEDPKFYLKKAYIVVVNSYDTGTVSVSDSSTAVTGVSTLWDTNDITAGMKMNLGSQGYPFQIDSLDDTTPETVLALTENYTDEDDLSSSTYIIYQDEYTIYEEGNAETSGVTDFRKIYKVINESGRTVYEYDIKEDDETGFFVKRVNDNFKFCLNYIPATTNAKGKWTIWYIYQPPKLDSVGDIPELPKGFDYVLQEYGLYRLRQRANDKTDAAIHRKAFEVGLGQIIRYGTKRGGKLRQFRLPKRRSKEDDFDSNWAGGGDED